MVTIFRAKRLICIGVLLILLTSFFYGCEQQQQPSTNNNSKDISVSKGAAHSYIKDASELVINDKIEGYNLEAARFIEENTLLIVKSNKVDYRYFIYYLDKNIIKPLPDILKNADIYSFDQVLKNGDMFFKITSTSDSKGDANDYVIIDGNTLEVKKKIDAPDGVDYFISISPDEKNLVYQKGNNLYNSDLDFKNEVLLLKASINANDETLNEVPRYGVYYNNSGILYRWLGYEWVSYSGTIDKDGKNNRMLPSSQGLALQVTNKLDKYIYNDINLFEYGVYDAKSGTKKSVFTNKGAGIIAYTFNKDLNYFVACSTEDLNKHTGSKVEIYSLSDFKKKAEFVRKDVDMYPVSLSVSPNGSKMVFLDGTSNGDWKIYIMDMTKYK